MRRNVSLWAVLALALSLGATSVYATGVLSGAAGAASGGGGASTIADGADVAEGATTDAAVTTNTTGSLSGKLRGLVAILADVWDSTNHWLKVLDASTSATGAAPPTKASYVGGLKSGATGGFLGGITVCDLSQPVNISTITTTLMVTGVAGRQVRICSFHLITALANNVAVVEGTGATCATGVAGMAGGTTAASGYNFAANGGITIGSGLGEVLTTATAGDSVCLVTSAATQLSGHIKYTIY